MPYPLTLATMLQRNRLLFGKKEVVTRDFSGIHRYTYADYNVRVAKLANALKRLGVKTGERVATFGWNSHRHLEAYFAVPCMGAVLHTLNIRLFEDQFTFIVNHAEDAAMLVDEDLLPAVEALADRFPTVRAYVIMSDKKILPPTKLSPVYSYEALLDAETGEYDWPSLPDENSMAALCYTTATTGNPKGVPYSHRGIYLHALAISAADVLGIGEADAVMAVVPMFHVNAWGIPFAATWMGAKQVFPGSRPDPKALLSLIRDEKVTITAGVPTVWMGVLQLMEREKYDVSSLKAIICGGSAAPKSLIEKVEKGLGVPFIHAYGMTETYPVVLVSRTKSYLGNLPPDDLYAFKAKQGTLVPGIEMRVVAEDGSEVPADGKSMGELRLRGPWITEEYYRDPERTREAIRGRVAVHRRRRGRGHGGIRPDPGPDPRPHQERRGVDLLHRPREHDHVPSGGGGGGGDRRPVGKVDRAPDGVRRPEAGLRRKGRGEGDPRFPRDARREMVDPGRDRVRRCDPQDVGGEVREAVPAGAVQGEAVCLNGSRSSSAPACWGRRCATTAGTSGTSS